MCTDKKTQQGSIVFPFQKVLNILVLPFMCGKNKFIESRERFVYPVNEPDSLHIYQKCSADDAKFEDHIDASPSTSEGVSSDCSVLMT